MNILILTPIETEYNIVRQYLTDLKPVKHAGDYYEIGAFQGQHFRYNIGIRQTGSKNTAVALATEKAIQHFQPGLIILLGITGGVKDVTYGDVVVATKAYGYESGKETKEGPVSRPSVLPFDRELIEFARTIKRDQNWKKRIPTDIDVPSPNVVFGPIASGDKVIASTDSVVYKTLKQFFNDTTSLEMEAIGFAEALHPHRHIRGMNIRGVSDLLDNKSHSDGKGWQEIAVHHAAAFTFELLYHLDFNSLKIYTMEPKKLVAQIMDLLSPQLQLPAVLHDKNPFKENLPAKTQEIWEIVRPQILEVVKSAEEDLKDEDLHGEIIGNIRSQLRRQLRDNESIKQQLEVLLRKQQEENPGPNINISNSKNVIQGSDIKVGGDFHLGDRT